MRDVVHGELQEGPLGNVDQADARPGGTAVLGVGSLHHGDTLEGEEPEEQETRDRRGGRGGREREERREGDVMEIVGVERMTIFEV